VNRGELWTVSGGAYAAKPRPALTIQDDLFSKTQSVVVIPLTTMAVADTVTPHPLVAGATRPQPGNNLLQTRT
jgi:mRNA interferase MazF